MQFTTFPHLTCYECYILFAINSFYNHKFCVKMQQQTCIIICHLIIHICVNMFT